MKFLDKVKNMFTEEVEEVEKPKDEVRIEQIIPEEKKAIPKKIVTYIPEGYITSLLNLKRIILMNTEISLELK